MSLNGAPSPRINPVVAWTGTEVLVFGGSQTDIRGDRDEALFDGALYDPIGDTWRPIPERPNIWAEQGFAVWTGDALLVWDSEGDPDAVWRFDPLASEWDRIATPPTPLARRVTPCAVWTGQDVLVWGGSNAQRSSHIDGAIYSPALNTWTLMPSEGAPSPREQPIAVWTGTEMLIYGAGREGGRFLR